MIPIVLITRFAGTARTTIEQNKEGAGNNNNKRWLKVVKVRVDLQIKPMDRADTQKET
jgi:hypothetical protein